MEGGSSIASLVTDKVYSSVQMAQDVLSSGQCIERIACELSRKNHGSTMDKFVTGYDISNNDNFKLV